MLFEQQLTLALTLEALDPQLLDGVDPDYMEHNAEHNHSFFWSVGHGLMVSPENENHGQWMNHDKRFLEAYSEIMDDDGESDDAVIGRYGILQGEPVVAIWHETQYMIQCLRDLLPHVAPQFAVAVENFADGHKVFQFPPQRNAPPARGHKYWNARQTSESVQTEAPLVQQPKYARRDDVVQSIRQVRSIPAGTIGKVVGARPEPDHTVAYLVKFNRHKFVTQVARDDITIIDRPEVL